MSSILKALRKLEEEKAASREGGFDIGRDILRFSGGRRARFSWTLPLFMLALIALFGWGGYRLGRPAAPPSATATFLPPVQKNASAKPPVMVKESSAPTQLLTRGFSVEPPVIEEVLDSDLPVSYPVGQKQPLVNNKAAEPVTKRIASAAQPSVSSAPVAVVTPPPAAASFILSTISYHDDPDARLAVINDLPVMIDSVIAEAIVQDILRDRVRLTKAGKTFEIRLSN